VSRAASSRVAARRLLRQAHAVAGLALSLLLLALSLSGGALVYKEAYWRWVHPELRGPVPALSPADQARAIGVARERFGPRLRSVKLPEPGVAAYHLYLDDGEAFLSADGRRMIDEWRPRERPMALLFDLHAHLMAGEAGERVAGVVGLLGALLGLTGLVLWWPARRRFSASHLLPRELSRRGLLLWHRDLGAATSPLLLLLLLTGGGLVFHDAARALLNGVLGDRVPEAPPPPAPADRPYAPPDAGALARVRAAFPDARLVFYAPPRAGSGVQSFRLRRPCELHPNGRSTVSLDLAGRVVRAVDACALPAGERAANALYPLHSGKTGGAAYRLLVLLGALALAALSAGGAASYLVKLTSATGAARRESGPARAIRGRGRCEARGSTTTPAS
jgi:uncharacterized iron-regulated membrane protein